MDELFIAYWVVSFALLWAAAKGRVTWPHWGVALVLIATGMLWAIANEILFLGISPWLIGLNVVCSIVTSCTPSSHQTRQEARRRIADRQRF